MGQTANGYTHDRRGHVYQGVALFLWAEPSYEAMPGVGYTCVSPAACGPLGQVKGVTVPEFIRLGAPRKTICAAFATPKATPAANSPTSPYPTLASLNPAQTEGAKARFSEPAATNRVGEVQTGNEYPPRTCRRGRLPEWSASSALLPAW